MFISQLHDKELFLIKLNNALRSDYTIKEIPEYLSIISPHTSLKSFREEIITDLSEGLIKIGTYTTLNGKSLFYLRDESGSYSEPLYSSYVSLVRKLLRFQVDCPQMDADEIDLH